MKHALLFIHLFGACLLTACAWFPESSQRAEMNSLPPLEKTLDSAKRTLAARAAWPARRWWEIFAAPELNRLIDTALADSPNLKIVAARLRQAQTLVDAEAAELYPTIDANIGFSAQRFSANSVQAKLAGEHFRQLLINPLVLRYHLDLWGRDRAALQAAVGKAMASEIEWDDARLLLATAVAESYVDLTAAKAQLAAAEHIAELRKRKLAWAEAKLASGMASAAPTLQAKIRSHDAEQQAEAFKATLALLKNRLAALAGKGPDWGRDISGDPARLPSQLPLPGDLPLSLLAHRPDVQAARLRVEAAAETIKVAETAFYPDVNLVSFAGLHSVSLSDIALQGSSLAYAVGPSIEFPIFEGGRLRAELQYQEAAYDEAVERYNNQVLHAVQEVADSLALWQKIAQQLAEQRQGLAVAAEASRLADSEQRAGLNDGGALLEAQADESLQRLKLAALEGEYGKTAVRLFKALGGGYQRAAGARDE